ncbi:hypothetical protein CH371_13925 [Leptospira wolffii]|uniref:Uncharacterized protein n=1 Tax=Leptospira wolffii TaxID=409998 RepID=A0A2M9ZAV9_9LEPT|nr:hypothetical protein CH371_13925 [Leptospira wolffii]
MFPPIRIFSISLFGILRVEGQEFLGMYGFFTLFLDKFLSKCPSLHFVRVKDPKGFSPEGMRASARTHKSLARPEGRATPYKKYLLSSLI